MQTTTPRIDNPTLKGADYRRRHKHSVMAILGDQTPPVYSKGSRFYNLDRWTLRAFVKEMCMWAKMNPECVPTVKDVGAWVTAANQGREPGREITIANTPDKLKLRTALALTGGAYHEALHTLHSCRRPLTVAEMHTMIVSRWAKVPDWSKFYGLLQEWNNIIEDIRIERNGCREFPGIHVKMCDLQDFILEQEAEGLAEVRAHGNVNAERGSLSIITATFRDVGLGYPTDRQHEAMQSYRAENAEAVAFVIGNGAGNPGPLTALLKEAINLKGEDDTGCVRLALDVISVLYSKSKEQDPANDEKNDEHQPGNGSGQECKCPKCQAPGSKLVVRPKSDGRGRKVKGIGVMTCTVCGHQEEVKVQQQKGQKGQKGVAPKFEGFDDPQTGESGGQGGEDGDQGGEDGDQGDGQGGDGKGDPQKGAGSGSDESGENGDDGGAGGQEDDNGEKGQGQDSYDPSNQSGKGDSQKGNKVQKGHNQANTDSSQTGDQGAPGGGHCYEEGPVQGNDWSDLASEALSQAGKGANLKDNNTALEGAVATETAAEDKREGGMKRGEAMWQPYAPEDDEFLMVEPSAKGKDHDRQMADLLYASVKAEAAFLRARLRQIVRALEMTDVIHGTRKGRRLSSRFLVDSRVALKGREAPKRAYKQIEEQVDTSLAAAVVLDESGSMSGALRDATRVMCAITEPLDALNCPVQVSGFRDGGAYSAPGRNSDETRDYHRTNNIVHDVFKTFDEPLRAVRWRFANTRATGGTPMADGVQFGLDALSQRPEGHRVLFVVTDGQPNGGHLPIIKRQCRLAKEAGIHVIGVGLGHGAQYVQNVFEDSVWTEQISDMPKALIQKLNDLVDVRVTKRGRKIKAT